MANHVAQLDTAIRIVTPENIAFQYRLAGPFRRLPAYLIDVAIRLMVALAGTLGLLAAFGAVGLGGLGWGLAMVLWFLLEWFYGGVFETLWNGLTPGKYLMNIRVLSTDGQPINALQAVMRNILRAVDAQPFQFYVVGLLTAAANDRFQRLGDLACGTIVVMEDQQRLRGVLRTGEAQAPQMAGLIPATFQASPTLARALAVYVERRTMFSWARRMEIARHLAEPLRREFHLPPETNLDLLLCGLYHREFIADHEAAAPAGGTPFRTAENPFAPVLTSVDVVPE